MFLGMQGELIALTANTKNELEEASMTFTEIIETEDIYTLVEGVYLTEDAALLKAKTNKHEENTARAKSAIEQGCVTFKNAQFETNAQTVGDLTATMLMLQAQQNPEITYTWLSKDDKAVELTLEDFVTLGNLIAEFKNTIWSNKYLEFKTVIENAQTLEDLEGIEINYGNFDV